MFGAQAVMSLDKIRIHLQRKIGDDYPDADAAWMVFHPSANKYEDPFDGSKLANSSENLALLRNTRAMTFEYHPLLKRRDTLFLGLSGLKLQEYRIETEGMPWEDTSITAALVDRNNGQRKKINLSTISHHVFLADSAATDRYMIVLSKPAPPADSIELMATAVGRTVRLDWTVRDGYELTGHVLERLLPDGRAQQISTFGPASEGVSTYSLVDQDAQVGVNKYRVTAMGLSGLKTLSNPATAELQGDVRGISLFPNPVRSELRVSFTVSLSGSARLSVVDGKGRVVHRQRKLAESNTEMIDASRWAAGVYRLVVTDDTGVVASESFIKE
jgi:hypothetical protein